MIDQKKMVQTMILNNMEKYLTRMNEDIDEDIAEKYSCIICNLSSSYDNLQNMRRINK